MTNAWSYFAPVLLLSVASLGAGTLCLRPARALVAALPCWLVLALEYFLGQGVLATLFLVLGLTGRFTPGWVITATVAFAVAGVAGLWLRRRSVVADAERAWREWRDASILWQGVALASALLFLYGFTSVAGALWVDSPAFYMAMSRLLAGTGHLTALRGYDHFSAIGLFGELHMAALFVLGMDGTGPRVLSWVAFIPTLVVVYGLARVCGVGRRGATITVAAAVTTTSIVSLWGAGKADLFAVGPALAACLVIVALWDQDRLGPAPFFGGVLFGFAALSKLSYIVAFLPALTILMIWQRAHARRLTGPVGIVLASIPIGLLFSAGFLLAFGQNLVKNQIILGTPLASFPMDPFFSPATVRRLLLTYPLVVVYGRYWGQAGTLSPIVLAFLPLAFFYLRWPTSWRGSRLLALGVGATAGLLAWLVLFPSIVTMRYIQATLLLFAIPGAAAAEIATRRSTLLALIIPAGILATVVATPRHTAQFVTFADVRTTIAEILSRPYTCKGSYPYETDCQAQVSINRMARPGDRVLGLSYLRMWLDPQVMREMSSVFEVSHVLFCADGPCSREIFWARIREASPGFRFILNDAITHPVPAGALESPPPDVELRPIYQMRHISAWEIRRRDATVGPPAQPADR